MEAKSVDDLLIKSMNEQSSITEEPKASESEPLTEDIVDQPKEESESTSEPEPQRKEYKEAAESKPEKKDDSSIDEYGNPIEKARTYTEDEVQRMIRDRLSRGRHQEQYNQPSQQQVKQESDGFQSDPNSEESWETQLESFIDRRLDQRQRINYEQQWRQQEEVRQADFESKFTSGMNKYQDFNKVVEGKPITDTMMLATRSLENPAAFIYGASKMHPQELDRISKIADPYVQASEVGRLHERMVKERKVISAASKPLEAPKSDSVVKRSNEIGIDQRIMQHAKQKFGRK